MDNNHYNVVVFDNCGNIISRTFNKRHGEFVLNKMFTFDEALARFEELLNDKLWALCYGNNCRYGIVDADGLCIDLAPKFVTMQEIKNS